MSNSSISFYETVLRLQENSLLFEVLELDNQAKIIILQHGGRIIGPFFNGSKSILWMHPAWSSASAWNKFLADKNWNLGGERVWIAPEIQFCIEDRSNPAQSYTLPKAMDPADYLLNRPKSHTIQLCTNMVLDTYNYTSLQQQLTIERTISSAVNPLHQFRSFEKLHEEINYCGYSHTIDLKAQPSRPAIISETWDIMQIRQGGTIILPLAGTPPFGWYYRPKSNSYMHREDSVTTITMHPENLFKLGIPAVYCSGRVGYLHYDEDSTGWSLLIRSFFVNPSGTYSEEPFDSPGDCGYAFHVYNSGDAANHFGEIECQGEAIGTGSEKNQSSDKMLTWFFQGDLSNLFEIASILLQIPEKQLRTIWPQ
ncbi:MAG: hypothetical protein ISR78_08735 [Spirochaetia bacterium]|nr:hypothetical protein [Spirochaetia bacterium]